MDQDFIDVRQRVSARLATLLMTDLFPRGHAEAEATIQAFVRAVAAMFVGTYGLPFSDKEAIAEALWRRLDEILQEWRARQ